MLHKKNDNADEQNKKYTKEYINQHKWNLEFF